jgi:glyoxylase-like metal-dependent hydrolase (beta-lactamase superfamily II)
MLDGGSDSNAIETALDENNISVSDIKWILLTHSDSDHTAALSLFPNAEIYMSEDEIKFVNGTVKRSILGYNDIPVNIDEINLLQDRQELLFGGIIVECIKTPGHTDGSMVYLIDGKYLFTGDAVKTDGKKLSVHPFTMDKSLANQTIETLKDMINDNGYTVFTSHYGYYENPVFE